MATRAPPARLSYGWRAPVERHRPHSGARLQRAQQGQQTQVSVTQLRASYIDDEGHRAGLWFSQTPMQLINWELPLILRFRLGPVLRAAIAFAIASFRSRAAEVRK